VIFDELDARMRVYETTSDHCVLPQVYMVARLDGRGFTRLTKEVHAFEAPFDERFRDHMLATVEHLMGCGFRVVFGYTQSDEISLFLHRDETSFGRKTRKLCSVLAGEASAAFSLRLGAIGVFDCRICELPNLDVVRDYIRWRSEDAHRNALSAHAYWLLRKRGDSVAQATSATTGLSAPEKNELLFQSGVNFNDLPAWQKRGSGLYYREVQIDATNRKTGEPVTATRRRLVRDLDLPMREGLEQLVVALLAVD
jgi:tRNA(His) guanylyltransferase